MMHEQKHKVHAEEIKGQSEQFKQARTLELQKQQEMRAKAAAEIQ